MIPFMKYRYITMSVSVVYLLIFVVLFSYRYFSGEKTFNYSIDFTGGTQVLLKLSNSVPAHQIRTALEQAGWSGAVTREFANEDKVLVRVKEYTNDSKGLAQQIKQVIEAAMAPVKADILQNETVGAGIGASLRTKSLTAVLLSLLAILIYIAVRFLSIPLAMGAIVALFHDAICMLAFFFLFDREISLHVIMAILAVLGYSINDTIVVFSQIRANYKTIDRESLLYIIDKSINQTLRRTILTSLATALTVLSILFLAGEALRDFAITLLIGIGMGTYSSICIASPIFYLFQRKRT